MSNKKDSGDERKNHKDDSVQEQIRLDQDVYDDLIKIYIRKNMLPESNQVFDDYLSSGSTLEDAATKAIVNEMANIALKTIVDDITRAEQMIETGNAILNRYACYNKNKNNKEDNTDDNTPEEETPR